MKSRGPGSILVVDFRDEEVKLRLNKEKTVRSEGKLMHRTYPKDVNGHDQFKISLQFRRCQKFGAIAANSRKILLTPTDTRVLDEGKGGEGVASLQFEQRFLNAEKEFVDHPAAAGYCRHVQAMLRQQFPNALSDKE